jgi:hypothetical protein
MNAKRRPIRPIKNADPKVYVSIETGDHVATFCSRGHRIVNELAADGEMCCSSACCACSDDDEHYREATESESLAFWEAMDCLAAQTACPYTSWR